MTVSKLPAAGTAQAGEVFDVPIVCGTFDGPPRSAIGVGTFDLSAMGISPPFIDPLRRPCVSISVLAGNQSFTAVLTTEMLEGVLTALYDADARLMPQRPWRKDGLQ